MVQDRERRILRDSGEVQRYKDELSGREERVKPGVYAVSLTAVALRAAYHFSLPTLETYTGRNMGLCNDQDQGQSHASGKFEGLRESAVTSAALEDDLAMGAWCKDFFTLLFTKLVAPRWATTLKSMRWSEN